jgi:class 3 adenylate cyclase
VNACPRCGFSNPPSARFCGGYVAQYLGDGILAYFDYPIAHEDDARRAVLAGLRIVRTIAGLNLPLPGSCAAQLRVRVGIHTGPVVLGSWARR